MARGSRGRSSGQVGRYLEETGYAVGKPPLKPPGKRSKAPRGAHAFEACTDGSLLVYVRWPDDRSEHWWDDEPIRIAPDRVSELLAACGDALAKKRRVRA